MLEMGATATVTKQVISVQAGAYDREDCLVQIKLDDMPAPSAFAAGKVALPLRQVDAQGNSLGMVVGQLDPQHNLTWVIDGRLAAGEERRYVIDPDASAPAGAQVDIAMRADHLVVSAAGKLVSRYVFLGTWKPHFYPLMGPSGNVMRGASAEHQHQTGLFLAYGGHGENGATNIWSDWDEPPYGPCGKMLHESFEVLRGGPVYGHIVERVAYIKPTGAKVLDEVRDMRVYPLPGGKTIVDITITVPRPDDLGAGPFIVAARVADTMRVRDHGKPRGPNGDYPLLDPPGRIFNSAGEHDASLGRLPVAWSDFTGKVGDGWGGIAFFDHPSNPGFPGGISAGGYGCMTMSHFFPVDTPPDGKVSMTARVYVHDGDAVAGKVAERYRDFCEPPQVTLVSP
jgi:hypothetical protein